MRVRSTMSAPADNNLAPSKSGILVLSGYGLSIAVERGHLAVSDGIGAERRSGRLARPTCGLKRLVVLGHSGVITLEAIRWLHEIGAALIQIDRDGDILMASVDVGRNVPQLRRAQAIAPYTGASSVIAAELLADKVKLQAATVRPISSEAADIISQLASDLEPTAAADRLRLVEAKAALTYWQVLADQPLRFARRDEPRVPQHWRTMGLRASPLTASPRLAVTPAHAILNYLYAMLEVEARIACLTLGLDPALGVLHADIRSRDSLAADIMEPVRPQVDAWLIRFLERRPFSSRDFYETGQGQCRVLPPLTHELAETLPLWAAAVAPIAERVASRLVEFGTTLRVQSIDRPSRPDKAGQPSRRKPLATPLTGSNRSAARPSNDGVARGTTVANGRPSRACRECGNPVSGRQQLCSDECRETYAQEVGLPAFKKAGPEKLAELRATGADPARTPEALTKLQRKMKALAHDRAVWEREHERETFDSEDFKRDILPRLQDVSLSAMMRATGMSARSCSLIRKGQRVPHPMYWEQCLVAAGLQLSDCVNHRISP